MYKREQLELHALGSSTESPLRNGRQLLLNSAFTFYTYSTGCTGNEPRWRNDGIGEVFFLDIDDARQAIVEMSREVSSDPLSDPMTIRLEKIRTIPITERALLSLLNGDIASLIESHEIVEQFVTGSDAALLPARPITQP